MMVKMLDRRRMLMLMLMSPSLRCFAALCAAAASSCVQCCYGTEVKQQLSVTRHVRHSAPLSVNSASTRSHPRMPGIEHQHT